MVVVVVVVVLDWIRFLVRFGFVFLLEGVFVER